MDNYGVILKQLRQIKKLPIKESVLCEASRFRRSLGFIAFRRNEECPEKRHQKGKASRSKI
jgi:hypothetical protein